MSLWFQAVGYRAPRGAWWCRSVWRPTDGQGENAPEAAEPVHQLPPGGDRDQAVRQGNHHFPGVSLLDDSDVRADMGSDQRVIKLPWDSNCTNLEGRLLHSNSN